MKTQYLCFIDIPLQQCYKFNMKKVIQVHIYKGEQYYAAECVDLQRLSNLPI